MPITHLTGDATKPRTDGPFVVMHIVNNVGTWGGGFVLDLGDRWPETREAYLSLDELHLGHTQFVPVGDHGVVANMVAQDGFPTLKRPVAVDYGSLRRCLRTVAECTPPEVTVHAPRIGSGIGGGDWSEIERIIAEELDGFDTYIYTLPEPEEIE